MKFRSPLLWFYLLVASLPFDRIPSAVVAGLRLRPSIILAAIVIVAVAAESPKFVWPRNWPVKILYAFLAVCLASAVVSNTPMEALRIVAYTAFVVALALAVAKIAPRVRTKTLMLSLAVSAGAACAFGLYQFVGDLVGLPQSVTGLKAIYSGNVFGFPRIQAMSLEPLYFANYLLLPVSLLIGIGAALKRSWLLGILFVTTLLLTLSRGGVGALVVLAVLWLTLLSARRRWRRAGAVLGVGVVSVALTVLALTTLVPRLRHAPAPHPAIEAYTDQITSYEVGNAKVDRAYTRRLAIQAFREHPLLGVGPGNYGQYLHAHNPSYPDTQIANSEPAELLAETGLAGFVIFALFGLALAWRSWTRLREQTFAKSALGWGLLFYLAAAAVQYYSFSTLYVVHIWLAIGLLMGLVYARKPGKPAAV
jgi:putative inorganic carbon (hco3(-)) transporter